MVPLAGQSINPNAADHKKVIERVVAEELKDVKEVQRQLRTLKPHLFVEEDVASTAPISAGVIKTKEQEDSDDSDDEIGHELQNKPVDRLKKLTRTERNLKLMKRLRREAQEDARKEKLFTKEINKLKQYEKEHDAKQRLIEQGIEERQKQKLEEKAR